MVNLTVVVDDDVARWARVRAAEEGTSLSRLVGDMLRQRMTEEQGYEVAMDEYLTAEPVAMKERGSSYPTRDEAHER